MLWVHVYIYIYLFTVYTLHIMFFHTYHLYIYIYIYPPLKLIDFCSTTCSYKKIRGWKRQFDVEVFFPTCFSLECYLSIYIYIYIIFIDILCTCYIVLLECTQMNPSTCPSRLSPLVQELWFEGLLWQKNPISFENRNIFNTLGSAPKNMVSPPKMFRKPHCQF